MRPYEAYQGLVDTVSGVFAPKGLPDAPFAPDSYGEVHNLSVLPICHEVYLYHGFLTLNTYQAYGNASAHHKGFYYMSSTYTVPPRYCLTTRLLRGGAF